MKRRLVLDVAAILTVVVLFGALAVSYLIGGRA